MSTSISDILKNSLKSENFKMNSNLLIHLKEKNASFYKIASVIEKNIFAKKIKKEDVLGQSYFDKKLTLLQNIKLQSHIIHSDHQFFLNYLHTETNFDEYKNSLFKDLNICFEKGVNVISGPSGCGKSTIASLLLSLLAL